MREELIRRLGETTPEEARLLRGAQVDRTAYTFAQDFTVDRDKMLRRGQMIALRKHTRFAPFPRHSHNYVEMLYMIRGRTVHHIDDAQTVTLQAGELLLLGPGACHAIDRADASDIAVNFIVLPQFFDTAAERIGQETLLGRFLTGCLAPRPDAPAFLLFHVADDLPVQNLLENLVLSLLTPDEELRGLEKATMELLFMHLATCLRSETGAQPGRVQDEAVLCVLRDIEENYARSSLGALCERTGVPLPRLSRLVHAATGETYRTLLCRKRLDKAAYLLRTTGLPVCRIIDLVGYDNTGYFHRAFRARFGVTPAAYRRQMRA